jgi:hypothetical protein
MRADKRRPKTKFIRCSSVQVSCPSLFGSLILMPAVGSLSIICCVTAHSRNGRIVLDTVYAGGVFAP